MTEGGLKLRRSRHAKEVWTWGGPDGQDQQKEVLTVRISTREVWRGGLSGWISEREVQLPRSARGGGPQRKIMHGEVWAFRFKMSGGPNRWIQ